MNNRNALFVVIEGVDGSGKGTQSKMLAERLRKEHYRTTLLSFPRYRETEGGKLVGKYLDGQLRGMEDADPRVKALIFTLDRVESRPLLEAHLQVDDVVICDRYVLSNVAHQAAFWKGSERCLAGSVVEQERREFCSWLEDLEFDRLGMPKADLTFVFDLPVDQAQMLIAKKLGRSYTAKAADLHEADTDYLKKVRQAYRQVAEHPGRNHGRVGQIGLMRNGHVKDPKTIHEQVYETVKCLLPRTA